MEPFAQDLYGYVEDHGPMHLKRACEVAGTIVSTNVALCIQDQFSSVCSAVDRPFLCPLEVDCSLRHQAAKRRLFA